MMRLIKTGSDELIEENPLNRNLNDFGHLCLSFKAKLLSVTDAMWVFRYMMRLIKTGSDELIEEKPLNRNLNNFWTPLSLF